MSQRCSCLPAITFIHFIIICFASNTLKVIVECHSIRWVDQLPFPYHKFVVFVLLLAIQMAYLDEVQLCTRIFQLNSNGIMYWHSQALYTTHLHWTNERKTTKTTTTAATTKTTKGNSRRPKCNCPDHHTLVLVSCSLAARPLLATNRSTQST